MGSGPPSTDGQNTDDPADHMKVEDSDKIQETSNITRFRDRPGR